MSSIARENVEILVRAGAPSRSHDDARYRSLAEAYLNFDHAKRNRLDVEDELGIRLDELADSQLQAESAQSTQEERESEESWKPDDDEEDHAKSVSEASQEPASLSFMDSPDLSFQSVWHNADSPICQQFTILDDHIPSTGQRPSQESTTSWEAGRSIIIDSQPGIENQTQPPISPTTISKGHRQNPTESEDFEKAYTKQNTLEANEESQADATESKDQTPQVVLSISQENMPSSWALRSQSSNNNPPSMRRSARILKQLENLSPTPSSVTGYKRKIAEVPESNVSSQDDPVTGSKRRRTRSSRSDNALSVDGQATNQAGRYSAAAAYPSTRSSVSVQKGSASEILVSSPMPTAPVHSASFPLPVASTKLRLQNLTERSASQPEPRATASTNIATSSAGNHISPWASTLEISSTPPATSSQSLTPEMLVTPHLLRVVQKMSRDNAFTPASQARELRPFERGNWSVDCSGWNEGLRVRAWDMLGGFVGKDMAGWGVRCVRSEDHSEIRVFCWGKVVEHTWFLLYLASEGKVRHGETTWVGGDGVPIVKMQ